MLETKKRLKEEISESLDEKVIHSSHVGQNFSRAMKAEVGTKACPVHGKLIKCSKNYHITRKPLKVTG